MRVGKLESKIKVILSKANIRLGLTAMRFIKEIIMPVHTPAERRKNARARKSGRTRARRSKASKRK